MNCFLITSVINTNNNIHWTYINNRSMYLPYERFRDTVRSINSIREKVPNSIIVVLEGRLLENDQEQELIKLSDIYINFNYDSWVSDAVDSPKKGFGEIRKLIKGIEKLKTMEQFANIDRIFKLSGRYWLNDNFSINNYSTEEMTFKIYNDYVSTVLYSIPSSKIDEYVNILYKCNTILENGPAGIEVLFKNLLENPTEINTLGVEGFVAVNRNELYSA